MLTLYRRHTNACGHADRYYRRCKCPVWIEGVKDDGELIELGGSAIEGNYLGLDPTGFADWGSVAP